MQARPQRSLRHSLNPHLACPANGRSLLSFLVAAVLLSPLSASADDWPQWLGPQHDGIWRESGILTEFPEDGPRIKWRVPVGIGYTGPAVADGKVYLLDRQAGERVEGEPGIPGTERILCVDAATGEELWSHVYDCRYIMSYPEGPRTTPIVDGDKLYTLGAMGDLICFQAATGEILWQRQLQKDFDAPTPVWGWAAHPRIDGDRLFCLVGGEGSAVVAFDKQSGQELWRSQTAQEVGYAPPVIVERGGKKHLIVWYDVAVVCLDPATGTERWSVPFPDKESFMRPVVTIVTPRIAENHILVSDFYNGSLLIDVDFANDQASVRWRADKDEQNHREGLNALMTTPLIEKGHIYGISGNGELRCLELATGKLLWKDLGPTGDRPTYFATSFIVPQGDQHFLYNDQGELILCQLSPEGYTEKGRAKLLEPTGFARGRNIVWSHPAFANRSMFARNDKELICVDLSAQP